MSQSLKLLSAGIESDASGLIIGEYYPEYAGYYFGMMSHPDGDYAYFIAPKSAEGSSQFCHSDLTRSNPTSRAYTDGLANSITLVNRSVTYYAARACRLYNGGGFSDWFLWAQDEAKLALRTLAKVAYDPGNAGTYLQSLGNSIPPYGSYPTDPVIASSSSAFRAGGSQALADASYWTSTTNAGTSTSLTIPDFGTGATQNTSKTASHRYRPVRKVRLRARVMQEVLGSQALGGGGTWYVPEGVTSISVLCVGAGEAGQPGSPGYYGIPGQPGAPGSIGTARYLNNITVTPGAAIGYTIGRWTGGTINRLTTFGSYLTSETGGTMVVLQPTNPRLGPHLGYSLITPNVNQGTQTDGTINAGWPGGAGGGGAGGPGPLISGSPFPGKSGGSGANGAIRIMFEGNRRQYPNTFTANEEFG